MAEISEWLIIDRNEVASADERARAAEFALGNSVSLSLFPSFEGKQKFKFTDSPGYQKQTFLRMRDATREGDFISRTRMFGDTRPRIARDVWAANMPRRASMMVALFH